MLITTTPNSLGRRPLLSDSEKAIAQSPFSEGPTDQADWAMTDVDFPPVLAFQSESSQTFSAFDTAQSAARQFEGLHVSQPGDHGSYLGPTLAQSSRRGESSQQAGFTGGSRVGKRGQEESPVHDIAPSQSSKRGRHDSSCKLLGSRR